MKKTIIAILCLGFIAVYAHAQEKDSLNEESINTKTFEKFEDEDMEEFLGIEKDKEEQAAEQPVEEIRQENKIENRKGNVGEEQVVKEDPKVFMLPKLSVKISPFHLMGEHLLNRYPSLNVGVEYRLGNSYNSIYSEVGIITEEVGFSAYAPIKMITIGEAEGPDFWDEETLFVLGLRVREQFRHYFKRGERAFAFLGAEAYYTYVHQDMATWAWDGNIERYYEFTRLKRVAGLNPIVGFSFFSKRDEFENLAQRVTLDMYLGLGIRFISKLEYDLPEDDLIEIRPIDGLDDSVEGNYFSPSATIGFKLGMVISK